MCLCVMDWEVRRKASEKEKKAEQKMKWKKKFEKAEWMKKAAHNEMSERREKKSMWNMKTKQGFHILWLSFYFIIHVFPFSVWVDHAM